MWSHFVASQQQETAVKMLPHNAATQCCRTPCRRHAALQQRLNWHVVGQINAVPQEYEYATSQRSSSAHLCVASVASLVACCIPCGMQRTNECILCQLSAYCKWGFVAQTATGGKVVLARWQAVANYWEIDAVAETAAAAPLPPAPLLPLPLLSPRSQNFKPTQNVDPFFQRGRHTERKRQAEAGSWKST